MRQFQLANTLKFASILLGVIAAVLISIVPGYQMLLLKVAFVVLLVLYYTVSTKKVNLLLLLSLTSLAIAEYYGGLNFQAHSQLVLLLYMTFFSTGVMLIRPALSQTRFKYKWTDILAAILVVFGIVYAILLVFFITSKEIEDQYALILAAVAFFAFVSSCFYFTTFNKHPNRIFIFIAGVGYLVSSLGGLIYDAMYQGIWLRFTVNIFDVVGLFSFVYFLAHLDEVMKKRSWLV